MKHYVAGCIPCQQMKLNTHLIRPAINLIPSVNTLLFKTLTMDFITDLLLSNGFNSILVITDYDCSKGAVLIECHKTIDAIGTAKLLHRHVYKQYGLPSKIISNRGPQFASQVTRDLDRILGIQLSLTMAYHPQTDGQLERLNQELETYLRIVCANNSNDWARFLPDFEFTHNFQVHTTIGTTPFEVMMGYSLRSLPDLFPQTKLPAVEQRIQKLQNIQDEA